VVFDWASNLVLTGAYIAEIEIDRETGTVELVNFTGADDFGRIINPLIVEGQVHGALVQGIGQALYENAVYDDESVRQASSLEEKM
jgi:aerobic carbon-monoxide dehydrogenase large subunit